MREKLAGARWTTHASFRRKKLTGLEDSRVGAAKVRKAEQQEAAQLTELRERLRQKADAKEAPFYRLTQPAFFLFPDRRA